MSLEKRPLCPYCHEDPGVRGTSEDLILVVECGSCCRLIRVIEMPLYYEVQGHLGDVFSVTQKDPDESAKSVPVALRAERRGFRLVKGGK